MVTSFCSQNEFACLLQIAWLDDDQSILPLIHQWNGHDKKLTIVESFDSKDSSMTAISPSYRFCNLFQEIILATNGTLTSLSRQQYKRSWSSR